MTPPPAQMIPQLQQQPQYNNDDHQEQQQQQQTVFMPRHHQQQQQHSQYDENDQQQQQQQQQQQYDYSPSHNNKHHNQSSYNSVENIVTGMAHAHSAGVERMCQAVIALCQQNQPDQLSTRLVLALLARLRNETNVRESAFDPAVVTWLLDAIVCCFSDADFVCTLDSNFLFQLIGNVLELLQCPLLVQPSSHHHHFHDSQQQQQQSTANGGGAGGGDRAMIRAVNQLALKMIQNSAPEAVFDAIMTRLMCHVGEYLELMGHVGDANTTSESNNKLKSIETVIRCLFRIELRTVSVDTIIRGVHEFLTRFPPSQFRNRNDLPIRSVKMVLGNMCKEHEPELVRQRCQDLIGRSSLVYSFIHMCLEQLHSGASPTPHPSTMMTTMMPSQHNSQQNRSMGGCSPTRPGASPTRRGGSPVKSFRPQQQSSTGGKLSERTVNIASPPQSQQRKKSTQYASPTKQQPEPDFISADELEKMFQKARKHETTEDGVMELANYVKTYSRNGDFTMLYNRCSDAFKMYLDRRIDKLVS